MFVKRIRSGLGVNNSEIPPSSGLDISSESGKRILHHICRSAYTRLIDSVLNDAHGHCHWMPASHTNELFANQAS